MERDSKYKLMARIHAVKKQLGMTEDAYRAFLGSFGVESSKELDERTLQRAVAVLEKQLPQRQEQPEKPKTEAEIWRKRVFGSIGGYLKLLGSDVNNAEYIKGVALNATGRKYTNFNQIPPSELVTIYYVFLNKQKTFNAASREAERIATQKMLAEMNFSNN